MRAEKLVEVKYHDPQRNASVLTVGSLLDAPHHLILIHETIKDIDLYSYSVIPKDSVIEITQLEFLKRLESE